MCERTVVSETTRVVAISVAERPSIKKNKTRRSLGVRCTRASYGPGNWPVDLADSSCPLVDAAVRCLGSGRHQVDELLAELVGMEQPCRPVLDTNSQRRRACTHAHRDHRNTGVAQHPGQLCGPFPRLGRIVRASPTGRVGLENHHHRVGLADIDVQHHGVRIAGRACKGYGTQALCNDADDFGRGLAIRPANRRRHRPPAAAAGRRRPCS